MGSRAWSKRDWDSVERRRGIIELHATALNSLPPFFSWFPEEKNKEKEKGDNSTETTPGTLCVRTGDSVLILTVCPNPAFLVSGSHVTMVEYQVGHLFGSRKARHSLPGFQVFFFLLKNVIMFLSPTSHMAESR